MNFEDFIRSHESDDTAALLLARHRYPDIDMDLAVTTLEGRRRLRTKVPEWYGVPSLVYPTRLGPEQCSSSLTARFKAALARSPGGNGDSLRIADLTGGLGVDSWAFSEVFGEVLYNEMNPALAKATEDNFAKLGVRNVLFRSRRLVPVGEHPGNETPGQDGTVQEILGDFRPDILFLDPARRDGDGRKVFRLMDCQPDVLRLLPELFAACPRILMKVSPMADITQLSRELPQLKAVWTVGADGECKELLLYLKRGFSGPCRRYVAELSEAQSFVLDIQDLETITADKKEDSKNVLFEPGKALAKAGCFALIEKAFGLTQADPSTHLYFGTEVPVTLQPFGKTFRIEEILPLNNQTCKTLRKRIPQAEVTARNLPLSSEQLRKRLGIASGGRHHLFGIRTGGETRLLVTVPDSA